MLDESGNYRYADIYNLVGKRRISSHAPELGNSI